MNCRYCGELNPEDATFCKKCGKRLDGQAVCPSCGKVVPADGDFCIFCGARLSPENVAMPNNATAPAAEAAKTAADNDKPRGIFRLISTICAGVSALLALIFVFCIGSSSNLNFGSDIGGLPMTGVSIFYYFGDAYSAISEGSGGLDSLGLEWQAAVGTAFCAIGILGTIACFIITAVRIVKMLIKKSSGNAIGFSAATYISFVCCAALFMVCGACVMSASGITIGLYLNGATVAGMVLGGIFLVASVVFDCLSRGVNIKLGEYILNICQSVVPAICIAVLVPLFGMGVAMIGNVQGTGNFGLGPVFQIFDTISVPDAEYRAKKVDFITSSACAIAAVMVMFICCVLFVIAQARTYKNVGYRTRGTGKTMYAIAGGLSVAVGVLMIISSTRLARWAMEGSAAIVATVPVFIIIFGLLLCIYPIIFAIIGFKIRKKAE